jgi:NAD(P)-dependent dehydrogenase (short-subunit alcohol dehydrogenase family)
MSVVVITGSGSGIGLETALAFARNGDTVVATMRDTGKADDLLARAAAEKIDVHVKHLDVSHSDTFAPAVKEIANKHGRIDVLINNAGIHRGGALEDINEETFRSVMETNCIGPLLLTKAVLPYMRNQHSGLVIMMSSLSGIAGLPGDLPYAASKFALEGATEALRHEVDRWGIRVALVEAGLHRTNIMAQNLPEASSLPDDYPADSPYRPLIEWQMNKLRDRIPVAFEPAEVAALFVTIANSNESRLRWPADPIAEKVLATLLAQNDSERDEFLRGIAGSDWWTRGEVDYGPG